MFADKLYTPEGKMLGMIVHEENGVHRARVFDRGDITKPFDSPLDARTFVEHIVSEPASEV